MNRRTTITTLTILTLLLLSNLGLAQTHRWIDPRCKVLAYTRKTPLVELRDGSLLTIQGNGTVTSKDEGKTWSAPQKIYDGPGPGIPGGPCLLLKTRSGALVMVYLDMASYKRAWDQVKNEAGKDMRMNVWAIRSLDDGKTWIDRQQLLDGYCGALINMIQTADGQIVAPIQSMPFRNRHSMSSCVSADDGKTWKWGNTIDLGGCGDHDGAMEGTVAELSKGRVLMLVRTNFGRFWEAYSDQGRYWWEIGPSKIETSTSPGYLLRLASGRLALVWNRPSPDGKDGGKRIASAPLADPPKNVAPGDSNQSRGNWYREELSLAFSQDDAKTWSKPVVIARVPEGLSYPWVFERRPGELWVVTGFQSRVGLSLKEADFVQP